MRIKILLSFLVAILCSTNAFSQSVPVKTRANTEPLKVGEKAPDFSLTDENGKTTTLSKIKGPVVLVFYRGYW